MVREITKEEWQEAGNYFLLTLNCEPPLNRPSMQLFKYGDPEHISAGLVIPNLLSIVQNQTIVIQTQEAFDGYLVILQ